MLMRPLVGGAVAVMGFAVVCPAVAVADSVRFRFAPAGENATMVQVPIGPGGTIGELYTGVSATPKPFNRSLRTNQVVTFRHPYSGRDVSIPLLLPENTPRVEHIGDRVRLNYGSYYVEARFTPDGGVDVVYNSGVLRPLPFP
jgi:hypothetical protein